MYITLSTLFLVTLHVYGHTQVEAEILFDVVTIPISTFILAMFFQRHIIAIIATSASDPTVPKFVNGELQD